MLEVPWASSSLDTALKSAWMMPSSSSPWTLEFLKELRVFLECEFWLGILHPSLSRGSSSLRAAFGGEAMPWAVIHHGKAGGILFFFYPLSFFPSHYWFLFPPGQAPAPLCWKCLGPSRIFAVAIPSVHSQLGSEESNVDRNTELPWVGTLVTAGLGYSVSAVDKKYI